MRFVERGAGIWFDTGGSEAHECDERVHIVGLHVREFGHGIGYGIIRRRRWRTPLVTNVLI